MITPLIRPIKTNNGTFYTFISAAARLSEILGSGDKEIVFSKFALLNIPDIKSTTSLQNYITLDGIPNAFDIDGSKTWNEYLCESFQNYCLNLESNVLSNPNYDFSVLRTPSERVFFKWLKSIGAIRFRNAKTSESTVSNLYVEEDESPNYQRVVKYIGEIDMNGVVNNPNNTYTELYVHIPSEAGNFPYVLFESVSDANYSPGMVFTQNSDFILGRDFSTIHPSGLSVYALFDSKYNNFSANGAPPGILQKFDYNTSTWVPSSWWFSIPKSNTYYLESVFGDVNNDRLRITNGFKTVEFLRSRLDGISLNFKLNDYSLINNNFNSFQEFGTSGLTGHFEFNVVLIYYDLIDKNSGNTYTNLYGVLFLDSVQNTSGGGGFIERFKKFKANKITGDNGNAYSFKINFKFDISNEEIVSSSFVNEYNTFSMNLFLDVLNKSLETNYNLENFVSIVENLKNKIEELKKQIEDNLLLFSDLDNLKSLINKNYQEILNIYNNKTSVEVAYNLDVIQPSDGIDIIKDNNKIFIKNNVYEYSIKKDYKDNFKSILVDFINNPNFYSYEFNLEPYNNFIKITDGSANIPFLLDKDVYLYIKDDGVKWKNGQSFKVFFKNGINASNVNGNFNFFILTDFSDKSQKGSPFGVVAGVITYDDFNKHDFKPVIEIICLDENNMIFDFNIF